MSGATKNQAFSKLIGQSPALEAVIRTAQIAAATDVHILIEGDTGTGKELMAKAIQETSIRVNQPFITINCAALPHELAESLLFGHEAGAFTDAIDRKDGYVQKADGGTLFLDEISDLSLALQAKLLRFIEYGECQRLGANDLDIVDARIIAATNRNLLTMVDTGEFRQDLFYRLSVVTLRIPSISERSHDIPDLIHHFLKHAANRNKTQVAKFDDEALNILKKYAWPGNVRELRNVCERVAALLPGEMITKENLPLELHVISNTPVTGFKLPEEGIDMESLEVDLIHQALDKAEGNKSKAARLLGLSRDTFLYRIKKHNLQEDSDQQS
jgi:DNA-binding NtrC family response regulator